VLHPDLAADLSMDHRADLYTLGMMADELLVGSSSAAAVVMRLPANMLQIGRETPRKSFVHSIRSRRRDLTWPPRRDCDVDAGLRGQLVCAAATIRVLPPRFARAAAAAVCAAATVAGRVDAPSTPGRRMLAPPQFRKEYSQGRLPTATGGRFK
jgi:hypothetical protein